MSLGTQAIEKQPVTSIVTPPVSHTHPDGINVRILRDTPEDAEFAARLLIEAFSGKYAHNITERNLPIAVRNQTACNRGQEQAFYNRTFVAELAGSPVGLLHLKFKGDTQIYRDDHINELGCWHTCRFYCFGCIYVQTSKIANSSECYLDHICVDERARGKGVGKVLMQKAEQEARSRNCSVIYLHVLTDNRARNLYEREGYRVTETKGWCGCLGCCIGPPGKIYKMEKDLR